MADLTAKFKLIDEMSDRLGDIASSGEDMVDQWERAGDAINSTFDGISGAATTTASTADGVASSVSSLDQAAAGASASADSLSSSLEDYGGAAEDAATQTDYWTDAVGNYDKSALEAIYTTEELVDMGLKSADALEEQERMFELCEQSASSLSKAMEASSDIQSDLNSAMEEANEVMSELANNEGVSAETKQELERASEAAAEAMQELTAAQEEAAAAMDNYDTVMASGTTDLDELEAAAERASAASERLAEANGRASEAAEELSSATAQATEEAENAEKKGTDAVEGIASALAAAGITVMVKEIAEAAYDLADAFSNAEKVVVNATGATGDALAGLETSMLEAYGGHHATLDETAGAIGEINTRMGLTGDVLTKVTGQFLDYADITGTNVVGSVQNVTKIMNKWGVEATDLEGVLDKLAYAGQISGASVDSMSQTLITGAASFQEMGLSLDNAISMLSAFELYGINSTTAITAMRTAVKNFSADGLDAETALQQVITQIATMGSSADATALAVETFGSRAGVDMANAIRSGAISIDTFTGSLDEAQGTLQRTAEAGETLSEKWEKAQNNISAAFTTALQPTIDKISGGLADVANSIGDFLNDHPVVTKAITAIGVGLGVVVTGIAGVAFATSSAIPAIVSFGTALNAALGPIGWVALAISGVVAAGTALAVMLSDANDETAGLTASSREQYQELQNLEAEYEAACEKYGQNSEEASRLKYQMDDLQAAYEANKQTVEEFVAEVDKLVESHNNLVTSYEDSMTSIDQEETETFALIQKLQDLATANDQTVASHEKMQAIIDQLNKDLPELALSYEDVTTNTEAAVEAMKKAAEIQAEDERKAERQQAYVDLLKDQAALEDEIAKAEENLNAEREAHGMYFDEYMQQWTNGTYAEDSLMAGWLTDLPEYKDALDELNAAYAENKAKLAEIEGEWEEVASAQEETQESGISSAEAVSQAYEGVRGELEELCAAYDEVYQSALSSFQGQFGLFEEASTQSETYMNSTVANAQAALDSQLAYWDGYLANIQTLKATSAEDLGVTQENYELLMSYVQDGSEEAAGLAQSMVDAINSGNESAVAELANTVGEVSAAQQEASATVADWKTNFSAELAGIGEEMSAAIEGMDLSTEASAAAQSTIDAYIQQIQTGLGSAVTQAQSISQQIEAALQGSGGGAYEADVQFDVDSTEVDNYTPEDKEATAEYDLDSSRVDNWDPPDKTATVTYNVVTNGSVPGHARGTTDAEDVFVAGEQGPELVVTRAAAYANGTTDSDGVFIAGDEGPELIVGQQGSTVFPAEETERIINAIGERRPMKVFDPSNGGGGARENVRRILLEIAGSGAIEVGGNGLDKEGVLDLIQDHLKPILMNIIQQEIYEEGELSYEY